MLTKEEQKMSIEDVKTHIRTLELGNGNLRNAKLAHMRLLLKYKHAEEKHALATQIKITLGIDRVGGKFTKEDTAKALHMTERQQVTVESKALKLLKRPGTGKALKDAFLN